MADTRVQLETEDWVRTQWMPTQYGQDFYRDRVKLSSGGVFDFDAVSVDRKIIASISTSGARTATGKNAVGKMLKIRSDIYFLLLVEAEHRLLIFTESDMHEQWLKEERAGRVAPGIEFVHVELPGELDQRLKESRRKASSEVSPR